MLIRQLVTLGLATWRDQKMHGLDFGQRFEATISVARSDVAREIWSS